MKVIAAIDEWAADFETRCTYKAAIGPVLPKVNIDAIQGGILVSQRTLSSGSNSTMRIINGTPSTGPWEIVTYMCFQDDRRALEFEIWIWSSLCESTPW